MRVMGNIVISLAINSVGCMVMYWVGMLALRLGSKGKQCVPFMEKYALMRGLIIMTYFLLVGTAIALYCLDEYSGYFLLLVHSERVLKSLRVAFIIWFAGVFGGLIHLAVQFINARQFTKGLRSASEWEHVDVKAAADFTGVRKIPQVRFGDHIRSAYAYGIVNPLIIMPEGIKPGKDRQIVLAHEMLHYKSGDLRYRYLGIILQIIFWFHPVLGKLIGDLTEWDELHCDELLLRTGITNPVGYATVLHSEAERTQSCRSVDQVYPKLLESKKQWLLERVQIMLKREKNYNVNHRLVAVVLTMMLVFGCSMSVAAGVLLEAANDWDLRIEHPGYQEEYVPDIYKEIKLTAEEAEQIGMSIVDGDVIDALPYGPISCTVVNGTWKTGQFTATNIQAISINITLANPSSLSYDMGIIEPDGTWRFVSGSGTRNHTFFLSQTGSYRVFIRNSSSTSLSVSGFYSTSDSN